VDVVASVTLSFLLLAKLPEGLGNCCLIRSILVSLGPESVAGGRGLDGAHLALVTAFIAAAAQSLGTTGGGIGHGVAVREVAGAVAGSGAAQTASAALGELGPLLALLRLGTGAAAGFLQRQDGAAAQAASVGEEAFARVAL
jgi:hypothetical protein